MLDAQSGGELARSIAAWFTRHLRQGNGVGEIGVCGSLGTDNATHIGPIGRPRFAAVEEWWLGLVAREVVVVARMVVIAGAIVMTKRTHDRQLVRLLRDVR